MKISNMSDAGIWVSEDGVHSATLGAKAILKTKAKRVMIKVSRLPCTIEVEDNNSLKYLAPAHYRAVEEDSSKTNANRA